MKKRGKKTIEDVCRQYKNDMQRLVDRNGSGMSKITISINDGEEILIAERKKKP